MSSVGVGAFAEASVITCGNKDRLSASEGLLPGLTNMFWLLHVPGPKNVLYTYCAAADSPGHAGCCCCALP